MKKSEVKEKLAQVKKAIAKIENSDDIVLYVTKDKHMNNVGYIHEINDISDLVKAHAEVTKRSTNDLTASIKALGLSEAEVPASSVKILGFKPEHWFKDIETRLTELRNETKLAMLKDAETKLTKHLSEDDIFAMDTQGIDELCEGVA